MAREHASVPSEHVHIQLFLAIKESTLIYGCLRSDAVHS